MFTVFWAKVMFVVCCRPLQEEQEKKLIIFQKAAHKVIILFNTHRHALYRHVDSPAATTTNHHHHHRLARAVASIFQCRTRTAANYCNMLPQDVAGTAPEPTSRRFSPCTHFCVVVTHDPPGCRGVLLQVIHSHQLPPTLLITFFALGANSPQSGNYFVFSQQTNR